MLLTSLFLTGLLSSPAKAADISIVDVRRNITLAESDPVYKDFYINAGSGSGLKRNLVITAVRKINIRDASGANAVGEISVPVGQLKIIAVFDRVAVAREHKLLSRDDLPMLEQIGIMTGDRIDLQGSFIDNSKPKPKKVAAEAEPLRQTAAVVAPEITIVPVTVNPVVSPDAKAALPPSALKTAESVEKTMVSGNTTRNE